MKFRAKKSTVRSLQHEITECLKANYIRKYQKYKSNNYVTQEPTMIMMLLVFIRLQCKGYAECGSGASSSHDFRPAQKC